MRRFLSHYKFPSKSCVGIDVPGCGRVHVFGECDCGGQTTSPALPQSLDRLTDALDALEAISGELALEDVLAVYARRTVARHSVPTYSLGLGGESVRCLECDYAHGRHADGCTVGAAQQLLALIWRKRSNQLDKGGEPAESNSRAAVGMRVPEQHHDWISRRFVCVF